MDTTKRSLSTISLYQVQVDMTPTLSTTRRLKIAPGAWRVVPEVVCEFLMTTPQKQIHLGTDQSEADRAPVAKEL